MDAKSVKAMLEVFQTLAKAQGHTYDALARYNYYMRNPKSDPSESGTSDCRDCSATSR
jgi:hypothetical protein